MPTVIEYNGITISGCDGTTVDQEAVFDDSNTDLMFMKFTIRTTGFVHAVDTSTDTTGLGNPESPWTGPIPSPKTPNRRKTDDGSGSNDLVDVNPFRGGAAATEKSLRHALLEPRKDFKLTVGQTFTGAHPQDAAVLIEAKAVDGSSRLKTDDLNNGPKPLSLKITRITGDNLFKIEYAIEVCLLECSSSSSSLSMVLSNRWTVSDDYNENQGCTRTIQGSLRIATANVNPNNFRGMVTPRLAPGFKRERMAFEVAADGLKLNYTIVDKEVHYSAPAPATWMSIQHREHAASGQTSVGECTVSLVGPRTATHAELLKIASLIVQTKLGRRLEGAGLLKQLTLSVYVDTSGESRVEAHAVKEHITDAQLKKAKDPDDVITDIIQKAGVRLVSPIGEADLAGYDSRISVQPDTNGKLPVTGAFSTYLQSPCYDSHQFVDSKNPAQPSYIVDTAPADITQTVVPTASFVPSGSFTQEHQDFVYTHATIEGRRRVTGGNLHMGVAKSKRSGSSSSQDDYPDSVVIPIGPNLSKLYLSIVFERAGDYPILPNATNFTDANGILHTLIEADVLDRSPRVMIDGTQILYCQAEFTYAMSRGLRVGESRALPALPWLNNTEGTQYPTNAYPQLMG